MNIVSSDFNFLKPIYCHNLIRLGNKYDGGYILPKNLIEISDGLLSFGYGYDCSFEEDYILKTNNKVKIYDHTCDYFSLIKIFLKYFKRFLLFRKSITDVKFHYNKLIKHHNFITANNVNFFKKKIVKEKKNNHEITINSVLENCKFKNAILKCDIEGAEYDIFKNIISFHEIFNCILFEFHEINLNLEKFKKVVKEFSKYYHIIHLHGNNHDPLINKINIPTTLEISFIKKKFIKELNFVNKFPINGLDQPNNPNLKDHEFEFID
jgi:hypothetical protein